MNGITRKMKSTMSYSKWDILLVPFPFTDLSSLKKRPALVISPDEYNQDGDLIIAFITSQINVRTRPGDFLIVNWKKAGLPKPSMLRMKFATIHESIVFKGIGRLTYPDAEGFRKLLSEFLA